MTRKFGGILDYGVIKNHKVKGLTDEQNKKLIRTTGNFEKAHLRAYLKGYSHFKFHNNIFTVKEEWV